MSVILPGGLSFEPHQLARINMSDYSEQSFENQSNSEEMTGTQTVPLKLPVSQKSQRLLIALENDRNISVRKFTENNQPSNPNVQDPLNLKGVVSNEEKSKLEKWLESFSQKYHHKFEETEFKFLERVWYSNCFVCLDGIPGTGKTFLLCVAAKMMMKKNPYKVNHHFLW